MLLCASVQVRMAAYLNQRGSWLFGCWFTCLRSRLLSLSLAPFDSVRVTCVFALRCKLVGGCPFGCVCLHVAPSLRKFNVPHWS